MSGFLWAIGGLLVGWFTARCRYRHLLRNETATRKALENTLQRMRAI